MGALLRDLRHAARALRRTPGFTFTAVAILALGIGLATAVFTIAHAIVIHPLAAADQDRLLLLSGEARSGPDTEVPLSLTDVRTLQRASRTLAAAAPVCWRSRSSSPRSRSHPSPSAPPRSWDAASSSSRGPISRSRLPTCS